MKRSKPRRKRFVGMVSYGQARVRMFGNWARDVAKLEGSGHLTALEAMESRAGMQKQYRRRAP